MYALESIINVVAAAFAWYSIYLSNKPRDREHPYGHGKIEFFSIGFEGAMILIAGFGILIQAVLFFFNPPELHAFVKSMNHVLNMFKVSSFQMVEPFVR